MGGKVYDRQPLDLDRSPLKQLPVELPKFKELSPAQLLQQWVTVAERFLLDAIKEVTGVDLRDEVATIKMIASIFTGIVDSNTEDLQLWARGIRYALQGIDLSNPGAIRTSMDAIVNMLEILVHKMLQSFGVPEPVGSVVDKIFDLSDHFDTWVGDTAATALGLTNLTALFNNGFDAAKIVSGEVNLLRLPSSVLTTASQIAAGAIQGTINLANLPNTLLTATSQVNAANLFGTVPLLSMPTGINPNSILGGALTGGSPLNSANLFGLIDQARAPWAAPIDALVNAFGTPGSGYGLMDLQAAAATASRGPVQLANQFTNLLSTFGGAVGAANNLGAIGSQIAALFGTAHSANAQAQSAVNSIAASAAINPSYISLDPTADASFQLPIQTGALPTIPVTQAGGEVLALISTTKGGIKKSIKWIGDTTANLQGFFVSVYKINEATGAAERVHQSDNIILSVSSARAWNVYNLPAGSWITSEPGFRYLCGITVLGTGTYNLVGYTNSGVPIDTTLTAGKHMGATRNGPSVLPAIDAKGTDFAVGGTVSKVGTSTIIVGPKATVGYVVAAVGQNNGSSSATWGGVAMTQVIWNQWTTQGSTVGFNLTLFEIKAASLGLRYLPSGSTTVNLTVNSPGGAKPVNIAGTTLTMNDCIGVGAASAVTQATSNAPAQAIADPGENRVVLQIGMHTTTNDAWSNWTLNGSTKAMLWNVPGTSGVNYGGFAGLTNAGGAGAIASAASLAASATWGLVNIPLVGMTYNAPATIANPVYSTNLPFMAMCGAPGRPQHAPEFWSKVAAPGVYTYTRPAWMEEGDWFDIIVLGGGAGGASGGGWGVYGSGGEAGQWRVYSLQYGVDIPLGTTTFTVTVPVGGQGGSIPNYAPGNGGDAIVSIPGYGTITAPGGAANNFFGGENSGRGTNPGAQTVHDTNYPGGGRQGAAMGGGYAPGGGGAGGTSAAPNPTNGGAGAAGAVWITALRI